MTELSPISDLGFILETDDTGRWESAKDELIRRYDDGGQPVLRRLIVSPNPRTRARACGILREVVDQDLIDSVVQMIQDPANQGHQGSLVFALRSLNCRNHFPILFDVALTANSYEVESHVLSILDQQDFIVSEHELVETRTRLDKFLLNTHSRPELTNLAIELERIHERLTAKST